VQARRNCGATGAVRERALRAPVNGLYSCNSDWLRRCAVLHKTSWLRGCHILATDGEIGHIDDFLFDERDWTVRYLVVDTSNWIGGRSVLIATSALATVEAEGRRVRVTLTRDQVKSGPSVESADIALVETLPTVWII
jgi:hypothetical protein